jgi:hypothetical protein
MELGEELVAGDRDETQVILEAMRDLRRAALALPGILSANDHAYAVADMTICLHDTVTVIAEEIRSIAGYTDDVCKDASADIEASWRLAEQLRQRLTAARGHMCFGRNEQLAANGPLLLMAAAA